MKKNESKQVNTNILNNITYIYILIPIIIFLLGWVKLWISIPLTIALIISIILNIKKEKLDKKYILEYLKDNKKEIIITLIISLILVYLSGIGGYTFQNEDHLYRNAIFEELINYEWPIYLEADGKFTKEVIMVYYFAIWLPSALIGKAFGLKIGFFALYLWCTFGVYLTFRYFKKYYNKNFIVPIILFILFSGLDYILVNLYGVKIDKNIITSISHLEWASGYQFSSFTTQLFWVFNQAIPAWLLTLMVLNEKDNKKLLIYLASSLLFSTFPTVGLIFVMFYKIYLSSNEKINSKYLYNKTKELFSYENLIIGIPLFIILATFITSNSTSSNIKFGIQKGILAYMFSVVLEFVIYYIFVFKYHKNKKLIIISLISLLICPLVEVNGTGDFCMRASIPGLIVLFILLLESLPKIKQDKTDLILYIIIISIGMITPLNEIKRTIYNHNNKKVEYINLITSKHQKNFYGYKDESLFVKYFAKVK